MRPIRAGLIVLGVLLGSYAVTAAPASASNAYDLKSPYRTYTNSHGKKYRCADSMKIVSASYIRTGNWVTGPKIGATQLRKSTACNTYWGYVQFYSKLAKGGWGNAKLVRNTDHGSNGGFGWSGDWSCDNGEGNGYVAPGQKSCYSPMIYAPSVKDTFYTEGEYRNSASNIKGWGVTANTR